MTSPGHEGTSRGHETASRGHGSTYRNLESCEGRDRGSPGAQSACRGCEVLLEAVTVPVRAVKV